MVSVIVPIYNTPDEYLSKCVNSILDQTYSMLQVLLIDDGSKSDCASNVDRLGKLDERIQVVHVPNRGVSAARNTGISLAKGEYIAFVDSDDWIDPDYIATLLENIHEADAAILGYKRFYQSENRLEELNISYAVELYEDRNIIIDSVFGYGCFASKLMLNSVWGKLYRTENISQRKASFPEELKRLEDCAFNLQYFLYDNPTLVHIEDAKYVLRIHPSSTVKKYDLNLSEKLTDSIVVMRKILDANGGVERDYIGLGYRTLLNTIVFINDYIFHKKTTHKLNEMIKFLSNAVSVDNIRCLNKVKLNFIEKVIVLSVRSQQYIVVYLYYWIKTMLKSIHKINIRK